MNLEELHIRFFRYILGLTLLSLILLAVVFLWPQTKKSGQTKVNISGVSQNTSFSLVSTLENFGEELRRFFTWRPPKEGGLIETVGLGLHSKISTTLFWVGEGASKDNAEISNVPSAWDDEWMLHFGGVDTPQNRTLDFFPFGFTPKENPFYFALPFNDFDKKGKRKPEVVQVVPWAREKLWGESESMLKNRWIRIVKDDKTAYAQWEDVGPFGENDANYVFGTAEPRSRTNKRAGLDVSPAVHQYLGLKDIDQVDWQFVSEKDVPEGPWKKVVTTSQIFWE